MINSAGASKVAGVRTVICKAWIAGTDIGIDAASIFVGNENYSRTQICNRDGIAWFLDVPETVHYFNVGVTAKGYKDYNGRIDVPQGEYYAPPFMLEASTPAVPSRDEACMIRHPFQGKYFQSLQYSEYYKLYYGSPTGAIPYFGGSYASFYLVGEGPNICKQIKDDGFTHNMLNFSHGGTGYNEPGQPYGIDQLIPPGDLNDDDYLDMCDESINNGMKSFYIIHGEGQDGYQDIKANFARYIELLRTGYDRTEYGPCVVCYDGVWPDSWSVEQMKEMIPFMRSILGDKGYLGFMFGNGPAGRPYLWVEDEGDYSKSWMDGLDIVLTTSGPDEAEGISLANKAAYMVRNPNFSQFQPSWPHSFIFNDNSRGQRYYGDYEWDTYGTVRDPNQLLKIPVQQARERMINMNIPILG